MAQQLQGMVSELQAGRRDGVVPTRHRASWGSSERIRRCPVGGGFLSTGHRGGRLDPEEDGLPGGRRVRRDDGLHRDLEPDGGDGGGRRRSPREDPVVQDRLFRDLRRGAALPEVLRGLRREGVGARGAGQRSSLAGPRGDPAPCSHQRGSPPRVVGFRLGDVHARKGAPVRSRALVLGVGGLERGSEPVRGCRSRAGGVPMQKNLHRADARSHRRNHPALDRGSVVPLRGQSVSRTRPGDDRVCRAWVSSFSSGSPASPFSTLSLLPAPFSWNGWKTGSSSWTPATAWWTSIPPHRGCCGSPRARSASPVVTSSRRSAISSRRRHWAAASTRRTSGFPGTPWAASSCSSRR